jgi:hypothetical protein
MSSALVWISLRFVISGLPLLLAIFAAERAFASVSVGTGRSAPIWMAYAGFAAVSGVSLLPWAMHLEAVNAVGFLLCLISMALWPILCRVLRRGGAGYRDAGVPEVVFRHRRPEALVAAQAPVARGVAATDVPEMPELAFLRRAPTTALPLTALPVTARPAIAMPGRRWHEGACAPSLRPTLAF